MDGRYKTFYCYMYTDMPWNSVKLNLRFWMHKSEVDGFVIDMITRGHGDQDEFTSWVHDELSSSGVSTQGYKTMEKAGEAIDGFITDKNVEKLYTEKYGQL